MLLNFDYQHMDYKTRKHLDNLAKRVADALNLLSIGDISENEARHWISITYDVLLRLHNGESETPLRLAHWGISQTYGETNTSYEHRAKQEFAKVVDRVRAHIEMLDSEQDELERPSSVGAPVGSTVFIVHGHHVASKIEVARLLGDLRLKATILHEQPDKGQTIIEKLESNANAGFAIVILAPDDEGRVRSDPNAPYQSRARQNVIFELGYFIAKLNRTRVCALLTGGVEMPGDLSGVIYKRMDDAGAWKYAVAHELKAAGFAVDLAAIKN